jgi:hypothetical protein
MSTTRSHEAPKQMDLAHKGHLSASEILFYRAENPNKYPNAPSILPRNLPNSITVAEIDPNHL